MRKLFTLIVILTLCFAVVSILEISVVKAEPKTIVVPDDYSTITAAIGNASEGDTVFVKKGTYEIPINQTLIIDKTLSVVGESTEGTIIKLYPAYNVTWILTAAFFSYSDAITITANNCKLLNLTVIIANPGGYISATGNQTKIMGNNITTGSTTGITVNGSNCTITDNVMRGLIKLKGSFSEVSRNSLSYIYLDGSWNAIKDNVCGHLGLSHSNNNVVSGNKVTTTTRRYSGIELTNSSNNFLLRNHVSGFQYDFRFGSSSSNIIKANTIADSLDASICLGGGSFNNTIYLNNFVDNIFDFIPYVERFSNNPPDPDAITNMTVSTNFWDNGKEGNYWDQYNGTDNNGDGIGDVPYNMSKIYKNLQDSYPLMAPVTTFDAGTWEWINYDVDLVSNSTISDLSFNPEGALIRFIVDGEAGTTGFCRATIPKDLLDAEDQWTVLVDGASVTPTLNEDTGNSYLYFTYQHSKRIVEIIGTDAIPEFPSWIILPFFLMATLFAIIVKRKSQSVTRCTK